jgi:hypothetical protein
MTSAARVARAAPGTPITQENIIMGSNTALKMFAKALIFTGVLVSSMPSIHTTRKSLVYTNDKKRCENAITPSLSLLPRNAENPTREMSEGRNANDRISRYGFAYFKAGAPSILSNDAHKFSV